MGPFILILLHFIYKSYGGINHHSPWPDSTALIICSLLLPKRFPISISVTKSQITVVVKLIL